MTRTETVRDVGEFALIERLSDILGTSNAPKGIGDDAAVLDAEGDSYLLATVDMYVQDVHFTWKSVSANDIGRRVLAVNISDIAAMGGTPTSALVSLALPPDTRTDIVENIYRGLSNEAAAYGIAVVGGNMTRTSGPLIIDLVMLGSVRKGDETLRGGAQVGDVLAVTGSLGRYAAARMAAESFLEIADANLHAWIAEQIVPEPRLKAATALAKNHVVTAMMDISDGLSGDIAHMCKASDVGVVIQTSGLPVPDEVRHIAHDLRIDPMELALSGGEDYELLMTLPPTKIEEARRLTDPVALSVIGRIVNPGQGITFEIDGRREPMDGRAWRHF